MSASPNGRSLLLTIDADWIPGSGPGLTAFLDVVERHGARSTVFVTGRFAEEYPELIRRAAEAGHEVGTHGWEHAWDWSENYRFTSYDYQRERIERATRVVEALTGRRPTSFRAPFLWVGETLCEVLTDLGYEVDSSVPARRYDGSFGMVDWVRYFTAPTRPYRPDPSHLARRGAAEIVEVPPSAFVVPVVMSSIRRLGLAPTLMVARLVAATSPLINFYCHPWEFVAPADREFPPDAPERYNSGTGPQWIDPFDRFVGKVLSWGHQARTVTEVARAWSGGAEPAAGVVAAGGRAR